MIYWISIAWYLLVFHYATKIKRQGDTLIVQLRIFTSSFLPSTKDDIIFYSHSTLLEVFVKALARYIFSAHVHALWTYGFKGHIERQPTKCWNSIPPDRDTWQSVRKHYYRSETMHSYLWNNPLFFLFNIVALEYTISCRYPDHVWCTPCSTLCGRHPLTLSVPRSPYGVTL